MNNKNIQIAFKRGFDFVCALIMIILLFPLMLIVAVSVKISSSGKIVFKQERVGKNGKKFMIYKFRTMKNPPKGTYSVDGVLHKPNGDILEPSSTRITKIGKFLRKTSLDELMQLFNILEGSMSFIGPRPPLPYQVANYSDEQKIRLRNK